MEVTSSPSHASHRVTEIKTSVGVLVVKLREKVTCFCVVFNKKGARISSAFLPSLSLSLVGEKELRAFLTITDESRRELLT